MTAIKNKLVGMALSLEAINAESARDKVQATLILVIRRFKK
jgi:hypothetical protein